MLYNLRLTGRQVRDALYHIETGRHWHHVYGTDKAMLGAERIRNTIFKQFREQQAATPAEKEKFMPLKCRIQTTIMVDAEDLEDLVNEVIPEFDGSWSFQVATRTSSGESRTYAFTADDVAEWLAERETAAYTRLMSDWVFQTYQLLLELAFRGAIEPGNYVITQE